MGESLGFGFAAQLPHLPTCEWVRIVKFEMPPFDLIGVTNFLDHLVNL